MCIGGHLSRWYARHPQLGGVTDGESERVQRAVGCFCQERFPLSLVAFRWPDGKPTTSLASAKRPTLGDRARGSGTLLPQGSGRVLERCDGRAEGTVWRDVRKGSASLGVGIVPVGNFLRQELWSPTKLPPLLDLQKTMEHKQLRKLLLTTKKVGYFVASACRPIRHS